MAALTKVLTLVFFVLAQCISGFNIPDGGNRQEHAALCSFFAMAGRKLDIPMIDPLAEDDYKYIQELNFTVAPETWQSKFYKEADRTTVHEDANGASLKNVGEEHYFGDWKEAATAFKKGNKNNRVKEILAVPLTSDAKEIAAVDLAQIAANAWTIKNQYPTLTDEEKTYTTTNPPPPIAAALFGGTTTQAGAVTQTDPFGKDIRTTARDQVCDVGHANSGIKSATAMLACICEPDNSNAADNHECTEKAKPNGNWNSGTSGPDAADLQKLAKSCGTPPTTTLTAAEIQSAIAHLRSLIHVDTNDGYLGHYSGTGCNGSSGNGICVKFSNLMTTDKTQFETKTWVAKFVQAANIIDSLRVAAAKAAQVNAQLRSMKAEANAAVQRSRAFAATLSRSHSPPAQRQKIDIKTQCDAHNKSKTACLGAKCAWKGQKEDDGPCTPTEAQVAEQEKQKDGGDTTTGGEAKKEEKCKGKLEDACTKAPECKWDGKECKDSSFLINKKLALSMAAAAFAALLF